MKISTNITLSINKDLLGQLNLQDDKFIIFEEPSTEEPKMLIHEKPKTNSSNSSNSIELF